MIFEHLVCCCCYWFLSCVQFFATLWTVACQASLSFTISQSLLRYIIELVVLLNHFILCCPLLFFAFNFSPVSGSFQMSWLFSSGGQSIGASASSSFFPMNVQGWFPLELTGLILQSKGLSKVFSSTTIQSINSSALSLLYSPTLTSIHDYW